jgi:hypothetical protein
MPRLFFVQSSASMVQLVHVNCAFKNLLLLQSEAEMKTGRKKPD